MRKYFALILVFLSINIVSLSDTKNETQTKKESIINMELPKEGETKKNIPFLALFDKKGNSYSVKKGLKVTLLLANSHFKMTIKNSKSSIAGGVKVNKKTFNEIAKQNFTVTNKNGIYIMKEE